MPEVAGNVFRTTYDRLVAFCCRARVCLFASVRRCFVVRVLSEVVGNVADRLYKPFARKPWLTVYPAHAGVFEPASIWREDEE